jgi:hypothetical protein
MKKVYLLGVGVTVSFALLQSVEARGGGRSYGGGHSFGSTSHFSAPSHYSAPSRSYSSGGVRYYSPRVSSMPHSRSYSPTRGQFSRTTIARNPTYASNSRQFNGNRITAFNSRNYTRSNARVTPGNRTSAARSQGFNGGRVVARHSGNWNRHWDRNHDHNWNGHRCHFHNGFWFVYDPWPLYPYGYGYYPYGGYYDSYYDNGYYAEESAPAAYDEQQVYHENSRVADVQRALAREGYYNGAIDGTIGPATRNALRRYQRAHGLEGTGQIDQAVIEALRLR